MPAERVAAILDSHGLPRRTEHTITDETALYDELERVMSRGYASDDEECFEGLFCIAESIRSSESEVLGAISVSAPTEDLDREAVLEQVPPLLSNSTGVLEISQTYSYWERSHQIVYIHCIQICIGRVDSRWANGERLLGDWSGGGLAWVRLSIEQSSTGG